MLKLNQLALFAILSASVASSYASVLIEDKGVSITDTELEQALDYLVPASQHKSMLTSEKNISGFLADLFTFKAMAVEAERQGLDKQEITQVRLAQARNKQLSDALFDDYIKKSLEGKEFEGLAKEYYLANTEKFKLPEQVHAKHILFVIDGEHTENSALEKAKEIKQKLTEGADFSELAKEYSEDPTAKENGGDLEFFTKEMMVAPFAEAAFAMTEKGQVSEPVKTEFGYHLIKYMDRKPAKKVAFDEVKQQLIEEQHKNFVNAKRNELLTQFRGSDSIKVDKEALDAFAEKMKQKAAK